MLDILVIWRVATLSGDELVYLRNITFSRIVADARVGSEQSLDDLLASDFAVDRNPEVYRAFLNTEKADRLRQLQLNPSYTDTEIAEAITKILGNYPDGKICGIESLGRVVFDTERGQGCCSDFSKAWIFYARYLGMTVREASTLNHTTIEFFDRSNSRWVWIDPLNRIQIANSSGEPLSLFKIRATNLFTALQIKHLTIPRPGFKPESYSGYETAQSSVLMWRRGTNFLEIERFDSALRRWGLPKAARQAVLLTSGKQPGWLILATLSLSEYLRALQWFIFSSIGVLVFAHAALAFALTCKIFRSTPKEQK